MINLKSKKDLLLLSGLSLFLFLYLVFTSVFSEYGFFIDELYFIACSKRLAFGYIDQPPLSILMLAISRYFFGGSILAIRIFSILAISYNVFITGIIARKLGGTRISMAIAAIAAMVFPVNLVFGSYYSMNAYELPIWSTIVYFAIKMIQEDKPGYWVQIGILMGLGLEMKHTIVMYGIMMILGMLLTKNRRYLFSKWTIAGFILCFILILPNLIWQYINGFPSVELYKNSFGKNIFLSPADVLINQVIFVNPFIFPLWLTGFIFLLITENRKYLFLSLTYILLILLMIFSGSSRPDRIAAIYTVLFAAGAVAVSKVKKPVVLQYLPHLLIILLIAGGILCAPLFTPLLSPSNTARYMSKLGIKLDIESGKINEQLPQWLADRLGWEEFASVVANVYHSLPQTEQNNTVILTTNYGEAGALEVYGNKYDLPDVFATHNSYYTWGPPPDSVKTFILVFVDEDVRKKFESVTLEAEAICEYCTRPQRNIPVYVARNPKFSISQSWKELKSWN